MVGTEYGYQKLPSTTFYIVQSFHDRGGNFDGRKSDDKTVGKRKHIKKMSKARLSMMVSVPGTDRSIYEDDARLEVIWKIIAVLKHLCNKIPSVKVGPWIGSDQKRTSFSPNYQKT